MPAPTITSSLLTLTSSATGYSLASKQLLSASPAGADMMVFTFRAWWSSIATTDSPTIAWDKLHYFGLSFESAAPTTASRSGFVGAVWDGQVSYSTSLGTVFNGYAAGYYSTSNIHLGEPSTSSATVGSTWNCLPANPTVGASYTGILVVKRSATAGSIEVSQGANFESLAYADFPNALTSSNTRWNLNAASMSGSAIISRFRPSNMAFPTYFHAKLATPTSGIKLVADHLRIDFFDFDV